MADELTSKLARRNMINEGEEVPPVASPKIFNPYTEFPVIIMRAKWKHSGVLRSSIEGDPYDKDC